MVRMSTSDRIYALEQHQDTLEKNLEMHRSMVRDFAEKLDDYFSRVLSLEEKLESLNKSGGERQVEIGELHATNVSVYQRIADLEADRKRDENTLISLYTRMGQLEAAFRDLERRDLFPASPSYQPHVAPSHASGGGVWFRPDGWRNNHK